LVRFKPVLGEIGPLGSTPADLILLEDLADDASLSISVAGRTLDDLLGAAVDLAGGGESLKVESNSAGCLGEVPLAAGAKHS